MSLFNIQGKLPPKSKHFNEVVMNFEQMIGFGVAGNFAGHLEQALALWGFDGITVLKWFFLVVLLRL